MISLVLKENSRCVHLRSAVLHSVSMLWPWTLQLLLQMTFLRLPPDLQSYSVTWSHWGAMSWLMYPFWGVVLRCVSGKVWWSIEVGKLNLWIHNMDMVHDCPSGSGRSTELKQLNMSNVHGDFDSYAGWKKNSQQKHYKSYQKLIQLNGLSIEV